MLVYSLAMFSCVLVFALFINMQATHTYSAYHTYIFSISHIHIHIHIHRHKYMRIQYMMQW
jgi:hypothetical protein